MDISAKHFDELRTLELWEIYKLRSDVFIVEQACAYPDIDVYDKVAYHMMARENGQLIGYLRLLPARSLHKDASIGRIVAKERREGIGTKIVQAGMAFITQVMGQDKIYIEAQAYALPFYEKLGFKAITDEFVVDGIPHVGMTWTKEGAQ